MKSRLMPLGAALMLAIGLSAANPGPGECGAIPVTLAAEYVPGIAQGLDPADGAWRRATEVSAALDMLITDTQATRDLLPPQWRWVKARAIHDNTDIYFRFEFRDSTVDTSVADTPLFADGFAMQIPFSGLASVAMGDPLTPVNIIFWRADLPNPQNIVAGGPGTVQTSPDSGGPPPDTPPLVTHSQTRGNRTWTVIIRRPMASPSARGNMVPLARGMKYRIIFANWNGANQERGGIKLVTGNWQTLAIK